MTAGAAAAAKSWPHFWQVVRPLLHVLPADRTDPALPAGHEPDQAEDDEDEEPEDDDEGDTDSRANIARVDADLVAGGQSSDARLETPAMIHTRKSALTIMKTQVIFRQRGINRLIYCLLSLRRGLPA